MMKERYVFVVILFLFSINKLVELSQKEAGDTICGEGNKSSSMWCVMQLCGCVYDATF